MTQDRHLSDRLWHIGIPVNAWDEPTRIYPARKEPTMTTNDTFTASNGVTLSKSGRYLGCEHPVYRAPADVIHKARQEFYRHLEDQRLGRWRDPDNPHMIVYPTVDPNTVMVLNEDDGGSLLENRGTFSQRVTALRVGLPGVTPTDPPHGTTAARYFAAHPEPKPWAEAEEGDIWVLKGPAIAAIPRPYRATHEHGNLRFTPADYEPITIHRPTEFTDGHKLWPTDE